jgi:hypothetical protein
MAIPKEFWLMQFQHTKFLGKFGFRLFSTPGNSVPSERSFSFQNDIHNKSRNKLQSEKVNKLIYISMNSKVLAGLDKLGYHENPVDIEPLIYQQYRLTEEEEVDLEEELLAVELDDDSDLES